MANDSSTAPQFSVADACIAFTQAIMARHSLMSPEQAQKTGQDLYTWFKEQGALAADLAPFAVRSAQLGTTAIQTAQSQAVETTVDMIKSTYAHYTEGL
ncbi:MAG: hypothetical protein ABI222_15955 [Opitutaceae bacterium]